MKLSLYFHGVSKRKTSIFEKTRYYPRNIRFWLCCKHHSNGRCKFRDRGCVSSSYVHSSCSSFVLTARCSSEDDHFSIRFSSVSIYSDDFTKPTCSINISTAMRMTRNARCWHESHFFDLSDCDGADTGHAQDCSLGVEAHCSMERRVGYKT